VSKARRRPVTASFWRGPWPIILVLGGLVLLVVAFIVFSRMQSPPSAGSGTGTADSAIVAKLAGVTPSVIDAVGTGGAPNPLAHISGPPLAGTNGKPQALYIGAEWCPYCAAERWAMIVALSHFGSFSGLRQTTSSSTDVYPDTPTLSFYGSTYTSTFLDFAPVELQDRNQRPLQSMTPEQQQNAQAYNPDNSIPFINLGNVYSMVGQGVLPSALQGQSWQQIAAALSDPTSPITRAIVGNANYLTAGLCKLPGTSAAPICNDAVIKAIAGQLPK
jgi:thiol-disulfide isomerase/thioredoxin